MVLNIRFEIEYLKKNIKKNVYDTALRMLFKTRF